MIGRFKHIYLYKARNRALLSYIFLKQESTACTQVLIYIYINNLHILQVFICYLPEYIKMNAFSTCVQSLLKVWSKKKKISESTPQHITAEETFPQK